MIKVLNIISDSNIGGAGKCVLNFLKYYDRKKFAVKVVVPRGSLLKPEIEKLKTDVIEAWKEIVEERRRNEKKIFDLTDGAYNIPAILSPYSAIVTADPELQPMR